MAIFTNQATLTYNDTTTNSNIVTGNLVETLSVTKSAVVDTYARDDSITYVVTVVNSGTVPYSGLTFNDNLGAYTFGAQTLVPLDYTEGSMNVYVNGVLQPSPEVTVGNGISVSGINVPANGTVMLIYQVDINSFAPLGTDGSITNAVSIGGVSATEALTATATVTPESAANLSITKAISPTTVSENSQLTYTFVIQNTGNTATIATDNLIVSDTFDPVLNNITVAYNDAALTEGTDYTYVNGTFTTVNGVISVPAATYTQDANGNWIINPGVSTITVTGTV